MAALRKSNKGMIMQEEVSKDGLFAQGASEVLRQLERDLQLTIDAKQPAGRLAEKSHRVAESVHDNSCSYLRIAGIQSGAHRIGEAISNISQTSFAASGIATVALLGVQGIASHLGYDVSGIVGPASTLGFVGVMGSVAGFAGGKMTEAGAVLVQMASSKEMSAAGRRYATGARPGHKELNHRLTDGEKRLHESLTRKVEQIQRTAPHIAPATILDTFTQALERVEDTLVHTSNAHQIENLIKAVDSEVSLALASLERSVPALGQRIGNESEHDLPNAPAL
jgi:hypothetical protein